ncbi:hypothetical protein FRC18_004052, partial [Serendipita sp. 400]
ELKVQKEGDVRVPRAYTSLKFPISTSMSIRINISFRVLSSDLSSPRLCSVLLRDLIRSGVWKLLDTSILSQCAIAMDNKQASKQARSSKQRQCLIIIITIPIETVISSFSTSSKQVAAISI